MSTSVIKCDGCGADMIYSPKKGKLVCPYCSKEKTILKLNTQKRDYNKEKDSCVVDVSSVSYLCPNCGGEVELESFQTATKCPFCGATNIIKQENLKGMKPDAIIPFRLSRDEAYQSGKAWLKKRWFAHKKFKKEFKADNMSGVYVPSFNFAASAFSNYDGSVGKYHYVTVGTGKNRRKEKRVKWYTISGTYDRYFDNVTTEATKQLNQKEMNSILPYDSTMIEGYTYEYVAGFSSERYNESIDSCFDKAKNQMDKSIQREILSKYDYDVVGDLSINTTYESITFNYVLLPIWFFGCNFKNKLYRFIVNGLTGKSYGKYPKSLPKILLLVLLGLIVLAGIIVILVLT